MKRFVTALFLLTLIVSFTGKLFARRGNPASNSNPGYQYYIVDSDDNDPRAPSYKFVDTTYGANWHRLATLAGGTNDDGYFEVASAADSIVLPWYNYQLRFPPRYISTNGLIKITIDTFFTGGDVSANNIPLPADPTIGHTAMACPMWGDLEFRTTGDSSKVFYRMTTDTCYVTYYNAFLKGTNGQCRATFQVVFARGDSSATFNYRSFDGSFAGVQAALLFEKLCTIGVQNHQSIWGSTYLYNGDYYAKSYSSNIYAQDLHNQLSVKFLRETKSNFIRLNSIDWPPYDGYEMTNNQFQPKVTFENMTSQDRRIYIYNKITDLTTGVPIYSKTDSVVVAFDNSYQYTASLAAITCGRYHMVTTISANLPQSSDTDGWTPDNTLSRDFVFMTSGTAPFYDDYIKLDPCYWHLFGATWAGNNPAVMYDQPGPVSTGSVILNRDDFSGKRYFLDNAADTMTTTPIDLSSTTANVWLCFNYQRGSKTDSTIAGITNRTLSGPEPMLLDSNNNIIYRDSLVVEALKGTGPKWNPIYDSNWVKIGPAIYGGLDVHTQAYRIPVPGAYVHNHSRFRIRLVEKNNVSLFNSPPFDDDDNWIIDGFQINLAVNGQTDLMPYDLDLGNGLFTHLPRNVKNIVPLVKVGNNGLQTNLAAYNVRLIVTDMLNRQVYHRLQTLYTPAPHADTTVSMPGWEIEGSQGGTFTAKSQIEQNFNEIRRQNDTIILNRTFGIDSTYAYDDGVPDTSGTMVVADPHFYLDFTPIVSDSLRGLMFYHLDATGTTNWQMTIRGSGTQTVASRSFSYNVLDRGFIAVHFNPIYLDQDSTYRIEFNMTQGYGLAGDGSRGLVWKQRIDQGPTIRYNGLYPTLLAKWRDQSGNPYLTVGGNARNGAGGGPILPMMRLIFKGSGTYLPVELTSFDARRTGNGQVMLAFKTAHEQDVQQFLVERESPGGWQTVATVTAENSKTGAGYSAVDEKAPFTRIQYRLSEVDLDGSHKIAGYANADPFSGPEDLSVSVIPNPTSERIHVVLMGLTEPTELKLYDLLGKEVLTSYAVTSGAVDLDASGLSTGKYTLQVVSNGTERRISVVIQK
ncbi:MAG TPA: T9SS type A sorting domain-containing protein [Candidatus Kapabacteria bacterium]|nr:T9SS type A sorting domain-containing protein [Candidatus Kapabacteria bacterium]